MLGLKYRIDVPTSLDKGYGLLSYTNGILALDTPYAPIPVYNEEGWNVETPPANADTSFNDASFYLARVTAPARLKLVTTGVRGGTAEQAERQVVTYEQGPARDFFVAASPDYVVTTQQVGETRVNSYALPGEEAAAGDRAQTAAPGLADLQQAVRPLPLHGVRRRRHAHAGPGHRVPRHGRDQRARLRAGFQAELRPGLGRTREHRRPRARRTSGSTTWWATTRSTSRGSTRQWRSTAPGSISWTAMGRLRATHGLRTGVRGGIARTGGEAGGLAGCCLHRARIQLHRVRPGPAVPDRARPSAWARPSSISF